MVARANDGAAMQIDQRAEYYLTTFFEERPFPSGLAFKTALRQSRLDFSLDSLDRVDFLLDQIRQRFSLSPEQFLQKAANADFVYLLGFYLGALAAQHSRVPPAWQDQANRLAPLTPSDVTLASDGFVGRMACVLGGKRVFLPLEPVLQRLFAPQAGLTVRRLTERVIVPHEVRTEFRQPQAAQLALTVPSLLPHGHSMQLAGWVAAQAVAELLQLAEDGQAGSLLAMPLLGQILHGGEQVVKKIIEHDTVLALATGERLLRHNPERSRSMVLCFVVPGRLPDGRVGQGLHIEVCTHFPEALSLTLQVPFEYQKSTGLLLHEITVLQASVPPETLSALLDYFYLGAHQVPRAAKGWARHLAPPEPWLVRLSGAANAEAHPRAHDDGHEGGHDATHEPRHDGGPWGYHLPGSSGSSGSSGLAIGPVLT